VTNAQDLYELLRKIRYDTTAIQAKLTDAFAMLDALHLEDAPQLKCPECGLGFKGPRTLAEHRYASHAGPTPAYWLDADALISDPSAASRAHTPPAHQAKTPALEPLPESSVPAVSPADA
jgi:hypothetical protein